MSDYCLENILKDLPGDFPWVNNVHFFSEIDSTNNYAKKLAMSDAPNGTIVISAKQTNGRGRLGRSFESPSDLGIYCSVLLRPDCPPTELMHLTCASAIAAKNAIFTSSGIQTSIKWTNDLVYGKKKLSGILTELVLDPVSGLVKGAVIGIGINCNQDITDFPSELHDKATSIKLLLGDRIDLNSVAASLIIELYRISLRLQKDKSIIMEEYKASCMTIGKEVSIVRGDTVAHALAVDIDLNGELIVKLSDGSFQTVSSGEVSVRGMYGYV